MPYAQKLIIIIIINHNNDNRRETCTEGEQRDEEWVCERERERVCVCVCVRTVPVCMCVSGWNCYRNYESVPHTLRMFCSESEPINVAQCPPTGKLHTEDNASPWTLEVQSPTPLF